jgi:hypothetical protein
MTVAFQAGHVVFIDEGRSRGAMLLHSGLEPLRLVSPQWADPDGAIVTTKGGKGVRFRTPRRLKKQPRLKPLLDNFGFCR